MRTTSCVFLLAATTVIPTLRALDAQTPTPRAPERRGGEVRIERLPDGMSVVLSGENRNRAVIGVMYGAESGNSGADSAGVRVADVQPDGPAAKAGLKSGDVITDINGLSLRLSSADAADPALTGTAERRLQRAMAKAKPGDDVELRVKSGGASRVVKLKAVAASELDAPRARLAVDGHAMRTSPPAIGVTIGTSGSVRDTLGLFISSVVAKGPAESAGVVEGERIAAINGIDVRVPREDVDDPIATDARVQRCVREVQKGEVGSTVTLRVVGNGRSRDVTVKTNSGPTNDNQRMIFRVPDALQEMGRSMQLRLNDLPTRSMLPSLRVIPRRTVTIL
jgi:S1-C subfamily serine protease